MGQALEDLLREVKELGTQIAAGDVGRTQRLDAIEKSVNELFRRVGRPGAFTDMADGDSREQAINLCKARRVITNPKIDIGLSDHYEPSADEIQSAITYRTALRGLWRHGNPEKCSAEERKSLSSFSFGANEFIMPPEMSSIVLSCLVSPTDLTGIVNIVDTASASVKFFVDNARWDIAAWQCEANCFPNHPNPDLLQGIGDLEIKPESLRYVACVQNDTLADSAINLEMFILRKVSDAFSFKISDAIVAGDGLGKPQGILHPSSGVPILDVSASTPVNQYTWQDLVALKFDLPVQWHANASYLMNQRTAALMLTMSDAIGRPLMIPSPTAGGGFMINGSPVVLASQMPDCLPGATPIAFGDWRKCYTLVRRQGTTMVPDPYTGGFCTLFRFSTRMGGNVTCPNAARLLRIR